MMHQPQGGVEGSSKDVAIEAQELLRLRGMLTDLLAKHTGMPREKLHQILERDTYLTAQNACEMGVIDRVIDKLPV
jgi:ATP-dependent Clp protease protease subunit